MKEVEIRYKLNDQLRSTIIGNLEELGWAPQQSSQKDDYYCAQEYYDGGTTRDCPYVVRVRTANKKSALTYKSFQGGDGSSWVELETIVSDPGTTGNILSKLGQANYLTITKNRLSGSVNHIEVNIDEIEGLGNFVEFEVMAEHEQETEGRQRLIDFAAQLGLADAEMVTRGYVQLMEDRQSA